MATPAESHSFRTFLIPNRCAVCDKHVCRHGKICNECGLLCHNNCMKKLLIQCGHKKMPRRIRMFGMELSKYLKQSHTQVPWVVQKCIEEIEVRWLQTKGLYRVSSTKTKRDELRHMFEYNEKFVDLSESGPFLPTDILKFYFKSLPEPIVTYHHYRDFISIAEQIFISEERAVSLLKKVLKELPHDYYMTLAMLIKHLHTVSSEMDINEMSPRNLSIVFAPTLFVGPKQNSSFSNDVNDKIKIVHLMIKYAYDIFKSEDDPPNQAENKIIIHHEIPDNEKNLSTDELPDSWISQNFPDDNDLSDEMTGIFDGLLIKYKNSEEQDKPGTSGLAASTSSDQRDRTSSNTQDVCDTKYVPESQTSSSTESTIQQQPDESCEAISN